MAEQPIIGYNVIQAIISQGDEKQTASQMIQKLSQAFSVTCKTAKLVIQLMREDSECDVGTVCTGKRTIRLAAETVTTVNVRACAGTQFKGQSLLFVPCDQPNLPEGVSVEEGLVTVTRGKSMCVPVPLMNTNKYDITVNARTVLGYLQGVKTAYAVQSEQLTSTEKQSKDNSLVNQRDVMPNKEKEEKPSCWDPPVKLDHLEPAQQERVRQILREECHAFSYNDDDIGFIPSLKLHITLHDTTPVKKSYMSVPKPLHQEVREYIQDLLNRDWITQSRSPLGMGIRLNCLNRSSGELTIDFRLIINIFI